MCISPAHGKVCIRLFPFRIYTISDGDRKQINVERETKPNKIIDPNAPAIQGGSGYVYQMTMWFNITQKHHSP